MGNWPGVTVEKKEGVLKDHQDVRIVDLPGVYSLSPYTLEEVVARDALVDDAPNGVLNIVDGTNLERNLYLTTQLLELGIPVVVAVNMMDVVASRGDTLDVKRLSKVLGCPVVSISALKGTGITQAAEAALSAAGGAATAPPHRYTGCVEHALAHIEEAVLHDQPEGLMRWYAIKLFEGDAKVAKRLSLSKADLAHIAGDIKACEEELDDDAESIITSGRYDFITSIIGLCAADVCPLCLLGIFGGLWLHGQNRLYP